jgi:uncharacterized protein (TIGR03437 family)
MGLLFLIIEMGLRTLFGYLLFRICTFAQTGECGYIRPSQYFIRVDPTLAPINLSTGTGGVNASDCEVYLNDRRIPSTNPFGSTLQIRLEPSQIMADGFGFVSVRSKSTGTSSTESLLTVVTSGLSAIAWSSMEKHLYGVQRNVFGRASDLVRINPLTKQIVARSSPLHQPLLVALDEPGRVAWVTTDDGMSVTPVSLPKLTPLSTIVMPTGKIVRRLWAHPTDSHCFIADLVASDAASNPGSITAYCSGKALARTLSEVDEILDVLFEKSGESWAYSLRQRRLLRVRLDSSGLVLEGEGVVINGCRRLLGGFGRLYCASQIVNKQGMTVSSIPVSSSIVGLDETVGLVYTGTTYRGELLIAQEALGLRTSRDPDLRGTYFPIFLPVADLDTFQPLGNGGYAYMGPRNSFGLRDLYIFQLKGFERKLTATPEGVTHAASLAGGPIAPGMIVSIFGAEIGPLDPVVVPPLFSNSTPNSGWNRFGVGFGETSSTILFASTGQINAVVPDSVRGKDFVDIQIYDGSFASTAVRVPVVSKRPAFFTSTAIGGAAIGVFPNGEIAGGGRNAKAGEILSLFGTGFGGPSEYGLRDGAVVVAPAEMARSSIQISICGKAAEIYYAGVAPGYRFGLFQFNVKVPDCEGQSRGRASLSVTADGFAGPTGMFLPVD